MGNNKSARRLDYAIDSASAAYVVTSPPEKSYLSLMDFLSSSKNSWRLKNIITSILFNFSKLSMESDVYLFFCLRFLGLKHL